MRRSTRDSKEIEAEGMARPDPYRRSVAAPVIPKSWQPPKVDFLPIMEVYRRVGRLWPAIIGVAFAIGLLGSKIGDGDFEDFSLVHTIGQTIYALFGAAFGAWLIYFFLDSVSRSGTKEQGRAEQAPGELFVTVFALIYLCMAFSGYFSPVPEDEGRHDDYSEPWE